MTEPKSILFVDDDADDTFLFSEVVAEVDPALLFTSAANGEEALQKLTAREAPLPHLIFMDLNMPRMGGKECLLAIKEHEKLKNIPVIMYTTSSYAKDRDELMQMGATYYITKPSNYNELKETLTIVIGNITNLPKAFEILNSLLV
ncbi:MAG TPA: response regulator [Flavisolibacter sp.]|nr:response regulator [Flavisolibacter sp.]